MNRIDLALTFFLVSVAGCSRKEDPTGITASHPSGTPHGREEGAQTQAASKDERGPILVLSEDALRDLRLTTRRVEKRPTGDTVIAPGSLEYDPTHIATIAAPVACRIVRVHKAVGELVQQGDPLVDLSSVELGKAQSNLKSCRARVEIAKTRAGLALKQLEKVRDLATQKMATIKEVQSSELESAARDADALEADNQAREAERSIALLRIEGSDESGAFAVRAPSPGIVVFRDALSGDWVEAGHSFLRLAGIDPLMAVVHPFERDGARIDRAARVQLTAAAFPNKSFDATYLRSGPEVDPVARTLPIRLRVANPDGTLRAGMSVSAEVRIAEAAGAEIVSVPLAAVQRVEQDWCVFIPRGKGRFERRTVARGRDLGGEVEILGGLEPNDEVVVEGAFVLRSETTRGADEGDEHGH